MAEALATLTRLADEGESGSSAVESPAVSSSSGTRSKAPLSSGQPYEPTQLSMQVREMRKGGDAQKRIQDTSPSGSPWGSYGVEGLADHIRFNWPPRTACPRRCSSSP